MNRTETKYAANDIAEDLKNNIEEILEDTGDTLGAIDADEFDGSEWNTLRTAIGEARAKLEELERMLDDKQIEADEYDPDAEDEIRYATYWD